MRKIALALALTLPLATMGCLPGSAPDEDVATTLTAHLVKACGFVPTPGTISGLVSAWRLDAGAAAAVFEGVAAAVCKEVTAKAGPGDWVIKGPDGSEVKIEGKFADKVTDEEADAPPPPKPDPKPTDPLRGNY